MSFKTICSNCKNYNNGEGNQKCLSCKKIKQYLPKEIQRTEELDNGFNDVINEQKYTDILYNRARTVRLIRSYEKLSDKHRLAIMAHYMGWSYARIGRQLGMSKTTVREIIQKFIDRNDLTAQY